MKLTAKKTVLLMFAVILMLSVLAFVAVGLQQQNVAFAAEEQAVGNDSQTALNVAQEETKQAKAWSAAIVLGAVAAAGAIAMGLVIAKAIDGIARQPEAEGKIRTTMMLGLVFIETLVIYALIVAILLIFVL